MRDRVAIAGIGWQEPSKDSGVSTLTLGARAVLAALGDAGLGADDVDGLATHRVGDSVRPQVLAHALGIEDLGWHLDAFGGGSVSHAVVGQAALAVAAGVADVVVCYRALNARSGFRMGGSGRPPAALVETPYQAPLGYTAPVQQFAMAARAHMERYGTTHEQLGAVAVAQRAFAVDNARALMREPLTLDAYLASHWICEPFRLFDCCLETDGAAAVVLVSAERARDLRQPPVLIRGAAWASGHTPYARAPDLTRSSAADLAPRLFGAAGVGPDEIDLALLYDCFTFSVLVQLEDYGFCAKGEGGAFVESGATARGGALPTNTHGGFLSEGYAHGLDHVCEAVSQLRGQAGARQVPGAGLALSTAQPGYVAGTSSALVLRSGA